MFTRGWLAVLAISSTLAVAEPAAVGVAPVSISVAAAGADQHNPHRVLGVPFDSWILAPATVAIEPDGRVIDVQMQPISVVALDPRTGGFQSTERSLVSADARRFEEVALAALRGARFEKGEGGARRRSLVNLAWKAYGGSMDVEPMENSGISRHGPAILASTFDEGTTFYLWRGVNAEGKVKRFEIVDDGNRRVVLGLPRASFAEKLAPGCSILDRPPSGRFGQNLDDGLQPLEPLAPEYPDAERRDRAQGIVMLLVQVGTEGSVTGVYPTRTTPGRPAFTEVAILSACRMAFNEPRSNGEPAVGLHWQHVEFSLPQR